MTRTLLITIAIFLLGCGPEVYFSPRYPDRFYLEQDRTASRVYHVDPICDEVGVVRAEGRKGELIEAIAKEAAEQGGNRYILRPATDRWGNKSNKGFQVQAAVVYRCP